MAKQIWTDARVYGNWIDLSGATNKVEISAEIEEKDVTTYTSGGWRTLMGGLGTGELNVEGFMEIASGTYNEDFHMWYGTQYPWTIAPAGSTVGSLAYLTKGLQANYTFGGEVGDVLPFKIDVKSAWPVARGLIMQSAGSPQTVSAANAFYNLGAVPTGKSLYAALHVLSIVGTSPSLVVRIVSDDNSAGTSGIVIGTFSNVGGGSSAQILKIPGPITDTWYRAEWTIGGTSPSYQFVVSAGIA